MSQIGAAGCRCSPYKCHVTGKSQSSLESFPTPLIKYGSGRIFFFFFLPISISLSFLHNLRREESALLFVDNKCLRWLSTKICRPRELKLWKKWCHKDAKVSHRYWKWKNSSLNKKYQKMFSNMHKIGAELLHKSSSRVARGITTANRIPGVITVIQLSWWCHRTEWLVAVEVDTIRVLERCECRHGQWYDRHDGSVDSVVLAYCGRLTWSKCTDVADVVSF